MADYGQPALEANKLLTWSDLCFRVGRKTAGEEWFLGAARRYAGKILEIRHILSCGHGSWKRPLELKERLERRGERAKMVMGLGKDPLN